MAAAEQPLEHTAEEHGAVEIPLAGARLRHQLARGSVEWLLDGTLRTCFARRRRRRRGIPARGAFLDV